jgi:hypothetical protein
MRKTLATLLILVLPCAGYMAWPLYELFAFVRAFEARDVAAVTRRVNFRAVQASLTAQIFGAYLRRTGTQVSPLAQGAAASAISLANPVVTRLVSPEALAALLNTGWPVTVVPEPPPGTIGISRAGAGSAWQLFAGADYGFARFNVSLPPSLPPQQRFDLGFRLGQWRWQLVHVGLPGPVLDVLADELAKHLKPPAPPPSP